MIKTRFGKWHDAYIIGTYANKQERERIAREVGAELIYCASVKEECYAIMNERRLPAEWMKYIDKWFSEYME
jgi:hypothetical protein